MEKSLLGSGESYFVLFFFLFLFIFICVGLVYAGLDQQTHRTWRIMGISGVFVEI